MMGNPYGVIVGSITMITQNDDTPHPKVRGIKENINEGLYAIDAYVNILTF